VRDRRGDACRPEAVGRVDHERHPHRPLEEVHLVPHAPLAQHLAVIGGEDHHRVPGEAEGPERLQQGSDLVVDVGNGAVVGAPGAQHVLFADLRPVHGIREEQPAAVRIHPLRGDRRHLRRIDRHPLVEVPPALRDGEGIVRVGEGDAQQEGAAFAFAGAVGEPAARGEADLLVEIELVGGLGDAGPQHRVHVVVPPVDALFRMVPVRRPAEIGGVDVGREPLLEAVQLVRADEVHLARERRPVAEVPQHVREGRDLGAELGGVVVDADAGGEPAAAHRRPRRGAERDVAVRLFEQHAARDEPVEDGGAGDGVPVGPERERGQLVGDHQQDVRPLHRWLSASAASRCRRRRRAPAP